MLSRQSLRAPPPNFYNNRRQAAIDHLIKVGLNPFDSVTIGPVVHPPEPLTNLEDRYLREMRTMPRLPVEMAWELTDMKAQIAGLTARISNARRSA
ncbi:MAG TPA: hypothetical protein VN809_07715 [Telmatospirillum sp.]|nr:hypothetical protein [Telmatospirillum sp.]